jgi:hypothetical protein
MNTLVYFAGAVVLIVLFFFLTRFVAGAYWRYRGKRVITCPDSKQPAAVEINAGRALRTAAMGKLELRLSECSRWPEKENCGQECLRQIEASPNDCLVRNIFREWYLDKSCAVCGKALDQADWMEHQPTVRNPEHITLELRNLPPEKLPEVLATHQPVCWNCHIAETFRREHPDLVVDRTWKARQKPFVH